MLKRWCTGPTTESSHRREGLIGGCLWQYPPRTNPIIRDDKYRLRSLHPRSERVSKNRVCPRPSNFIVFPDHFEAKDVLLGRNFLQNYKILVDLTAMRIIIRIPNAPRHFKPVHGVSDHEPFSLIPTEQIVLGPLERKLVRAQVISQQPNEYHFRNVMIHHSGLHYRYPFVPEDTLTSVGDDVTVFLAMRNKTPQVNITIHGKTILGKAEPATFVFEPIAVEQLDEAAVLFVEHTSRIHDMDLSDTSSEFSSLGTSPRKDSQMQSRRAKLASLRSISTFLLAMG